MASRTENNQLRMQLQQLLEEKNKLAQGLKQKLAGTISMKNELEARAQELESQNNNLAARVAASNVAGQAADGPEADELRARVRTLESENAAILARLKVKIQDVLSENYDLTMKLGEMEMQQIDPMELQELRKEVTVLLSEKAAFTNKHGEQKVALQNAQMWHAQNQHLKRQLEKVQGDKDSASARILKIKADLGELDRETKASSNKCSQLAGDLAEHERQMLVEKDSARNSQLWIQQNEMLRNQIERIEKENRVIKARVTDWESGNKDMAAEKAEVEKLLAENEENAKQLLGKVASVVDETRQLNESIPSIEAEIGNLIASKSGLQMQVRQLKRKGEAAAQRCDLVRKRLLDVEEEKNALILKNEELISNLKKVEEWDQQNDELRWTLQDMLDEHTRLLEHVERFYEEDPVSDPMEQSSLEGTPTSSSPLAEAMASSGEGVTPNNRVRLQRPSKSLSGERMFCDGRLSKLAGERKQKTSYSDLKARGSDLSRGNNIHDIVRRAQATAEEQVDVRAAIRHNRVDAEDGEDTEEIKFVVDETSSGKFAQIKCATLEKLVERLTYEKFPDMEYNQAFMLTYRSFSTPLEVLELAIQRYCITPPAGLDAEGLKDFKAKKQIPIRLRVFNVLKGWMADSFYDFENDDQLVATVLDFVENTMPATGMARPAQALKKTLTRKLQEVKDRELFEAQASHPALSEKQKIKSFEKVDSKALARTICVEEHAIYNKIAPKECFRLAWSKKNREREAPNILKLVRRFNDMSTWVQYEILTGAPAGQHRARASLIKKFVRLASDLIELNNLNGCMAVVAGLGSNSVYRLKHAWARVDSRTMAQFSDLKDIVSAAHSYKKLRNFLHMANPPCIPYLGMYLTDLTFIEDGNPDFVDGLINFVKRRFYANVIREIQQYQQVKYRMEADPACSFFLKQQWDLARKALPEENTAYSLSLQMEPRGT